MDFAGLAAGAGLGVAAATNPSVAKSMLNVGNTAIKAQTKMFPWIILFMLLLFTGFGLLAWHFINKMSRDEQ